MKIAAITQREWGVAHQAASSSWMDTAGTVVRSARDAASGWSQLPVRQRCAALIRLHDILANDAERLTQLLSGEVGKPLQEAYGSDLLPSMAALRWLARNAPQHLKERHIARHAVQVPDAYGVIGVIGTWNYPLYLNIAPIAWAVAAGNSVVWKPSEYADRTAFRLAELLEEAGLPVFIITGGPAVGQALCRAGCDKIAFTGGSETGRRILATLAESGTPAVMELSGCDAMLVCRGADVAAAAKSAVWGRCSNAGQSCVAPQRVFVQREMYDTFLRECDAGVAALRLGVDFSPMCTDALEDRALEFVVDAVSQGARIVPEGRKEAASLTLMPAVLADCTPAMRVLREDFFGPILAVCPVENETEAIAHTNNCPMRLSASVWTSDLRRGRKIARQLRVGTVSLNEVLLDAADPALPFGGHGASGFGKQRGIAGLDEFVQWKVIATHPHGGARRHLFPYRPETLEILKGLTAFYSGRTLSAKAQALRTLAGAALQWQKTARSDRDGGEKDG